MTPRKRQIKRLDDLCKTYIKLRDNLTCQRCGKQYPITENGKIPQGLDWSHFIGRRKHSVRWSPENTCAHCCGCHSYLEGNPHEFVRWILENKHTQESYDILIYKSNQVFKGDLTLIELWLEQELNKLLPKFNRLNYPFLKDFYKD